jgi:uncharacterized protein YceH (UPF0502 family)
MHDNAPAANDQPALEILDAIETRIVGCLVEKASTTPEAYPLTENAIVVACNQKTSREPVMHLEPGTVAHALRVLEGKRLAKVAQSSQRALRYEHRFDAVYGTTMRQRAVLCVMMLRGPQTLAELQTRTDRIADFPTVDDVRDTLERLIQREPPLAIRIPRAHGQREDRYMHLLSGPVEIENFAVADTNAAAATSSSRTELVARVERLEQELATLREELAELRQRVAGTSVD